MTIDIKTIFTAFALAALLAFPGGAIAAKTNGTPAALFIQTLGNKALNSLTAKDLPAAERASRVRDLLRADFDVPTIGRFVAGRGWNPATEAQRREYMNLFEDMIVKTYTRRFADYSGQSFKVLNSADAGGGDSLVRSQIIQIDGPPVQVDWRVRDNKGQLKVVDVVVEQISMSVTQQQDFASIMGGTGDLGKLIASLHQRVGKAPDKAK